MQRKYADTWSSSDIPFLRLTVGRTCVVDEAGQVALARGVDRVVATQRHQIEMIGSRVLLNATVALRSVDNLAHVFDHEFATPQRGSAKQTVTLATNLSAHTSAEGRERERN